MIPRDEARRPRYLLSYAGHQVFMDHSVVVCRMTDITGSLTLPCAAALDGPRRVSGRGAKGSSRGGPSDGPPHIESAEVALTSALSSFPRLWLWDLPRYGPFRVPNGCDDAGALGDNDEQFAHSAWLDRNLVEGVDPAPGRRQFSPDANGVVADVKCRRHDVHAVRDGRGNTAPVQRIRHGVAGPQDT